MSNKHTSHGPLNPMAGCLVLGRKIGQRIHIGNDINIEVTRVRGDRVTLSVHAPRDVKVLRGELFDVPKSSNGDGELQEGGQQ